MSRAGRGPPAADSPARENLHSQVRRGGAADSLPCLSQNRPTPAGVPHRGRRPGTLQWRTHHGLGVDAPRVCRLRRRGDSVLCRRGQGPPGTRRRDPLTAGDALGISVNTVRKHIRNLYEKLEVHTRSEAVGKALRGGWI
ncbi:MAG: response regulator transcription factor [Thermoanaerobaculia bacterium]|nr:response regulator transcription factor [Thermoanaerobaculia bacterium]